MRSLFEDFKHYYNKLEEDSNITEEYDSSGNPLTKEQSEYFKNSKVRDKSGKLLLLYRGTSKDNNRVTFNGDYKWLSVRKSYADEFAKAINGDTFKVYANCSNILIIGNTDVPAFMIGTRVKSMKSLNPIYKILMKMGCNDDDYFKLIDDFMNETHYTEEDCNSKEVKLFSIVRTRTFKNLVARQGYDAVYTLEQGGNSCFGVLDNKNVKFASNKTPTNKPGLNENKVLN